MKIKDLLTIVVDDVCIYREILLGDDDFDYENLYIGKLRDAPDELIECKIRVLGAKKKDFIEIEII